MRWNQGRATIDRLIADGELQRVPPSREHADQLLVQARKDLGSAELLRDSNPKRAYESLYGAARMALTAVLENQGVRATSHGGHIAPYSAVAAQLDPPMGAVLRPFDRMRRTRNRAEYPSFTTPEVTADNVTTDLSAAASIVEICACRRKLNTGSGSGPNNVNVTAEPGRSAHDRGQLTPVFRGVDVHDQRRGLTDVRFVCL